MTFLYVADGRFTVNVLERFSLKLLAATIARMYHEAAFNEEAG